MAAANSNIQLTDLDFNNIKTNLKTFLQAQDTLKDYNYEGAALSTLLDVLAYNTQYNAYYLNMVANEMFLDSALQRSSVVSHSKLLNYVPKSSIAPSAKINLKVNQVTDHSLTLPKFTHFLSEAIDGVNYNFVTTDSQTVNVSTNTAIFNNVTIRQGIPNSLSFTVDSITNPKYIFEIPETNVDTGTIQITVQTSSIDTSYEIFTLSTNYLTLDSTTPVYFLQESLSGTYEVYFGDGILGKKLTDGNIVKISYIITNGSASAGANNFVLMDSISGYANTTIYSITSASQGGDRESISSIKYHASKSYAAQNRAVTKEDYITVVQNNNLGYQFDAVNVWGGEENSPPVYGQVFVCVKPAGSYTLTSTQKQRLIDDVISPISMMTVKPVIIDPDYTYLKINSNVVYDQKKTNLTSGQLQSSIVSSIQTFASSTLNTFNSTFSSSDLTTTIQNVDPSILTNESSIQLQKKFYPSLKKSENYKLYFNVPLKRGVLTSGISSYPALQFRDPSNPSTIIDGVLIEEVPTTTAGIDSISLINPGYSYQTTPTVTIYGDGTGATAEALIDINGKITSITVTNSGQNYTQATVLITPASNDSSGQGGAAVALLQGQYGTLRTYYYNSNNVKTIFNTNVGTVDYTNGVISLNSFSPYNVDNDLGQLTISVNPTSTIISSQYNRIITVDSNDPTSINVNVTVKN